MNPKGTVSRIFLAISILASTNIFPFAINYYIGSNKTASAQIVESNNNQLFYIYKGQRIPLTQQKDAIAVEFKPLPKTRTRGSSPDPLYLQLEKDLQTGTRTRGGGNPQIQVKPLGKNYALVTLTSSQNFDIKKKIQNQNYVKASLPILSRADSQDTIVLPNEIIVNFEANISDRDKESILKQKNLEIIRPLRFFPNIYIVKSTVASGTDILNVSSKLDGVKGITSAVPNFLQSVSSFINIENIEEQNSEGFNDDLSTQSINKTTTNVTNSGKAEIDYLGLQWHLNSTPLKECLPQKINGFNALQNCLKQRTTENSSSKSSSKSKSSRTDLHVTEAWKNSNGGKGVVVAVIDSLIQWDHPDLRNSLYKVEAADKCPGEVYGWDFSQPSSSKKPCEIGDSDTSVSPLELNALKRKLHDTFKLSDRKLIRRYLTPKIRQQIRFRPSEKQLAEYLRRKIRSEVGGEFHGTLVSGVIAAKPDNSQGQDSQGIWGVAPNAKILPVRVFGLNGSISPSSYIEAVGYAANRGADVINLSLGKTLPTDVEEFALSQVLQQNPKLVIVASSGNSNYTQVAYPSGYSGILSVGASNLFGDRAYYSNYGKGLDVVAPGGDLSTSAGWLGGIPTTGGTWMDKFWNGLAFPNSRWSPTIDFKGKYWWMQGTSFSSPAVAGVVALMKGEDTDGKLNREQLVNILKSTASYDNLKISEPDKKSYRTVVNKGLIPSSVTEKQFFFGSGLVNADAAVRAVKK
ncbi:S8 family peptidase [Mastigocoleus testarum]|uniref:Peptidase S8/S53 subtilisin kexin sedolisin n=1 Tax=Mastigocoleus testarum BC008 TaxID=371196 RepID=A0A0V7ZHZ0_9CYAN|nr:S8 family serine peptidase [Mastigocoleus testarum]KST63862.1 peptidase S8/S53 subtilisin kexin sedolisin [Mastigocoleus testarum BC008]KST64197.1 peptidase S8/S53 subtilisin kexin sedolisin [Mastigocoleus testarum BC008]